LGPLVQPYARLDKSGRLRFNMAKTEYPELPLIRISSLVNWLEERYNKVEDRIRRSHEVSRALLLEFNRVARDHGVRPIVAGIMPGEDLLASCKQEGAKTADISVDISRNEYNLLPLDGHPNANANREYAGKLFRALRAAGL